MTTLHSFPVFSTANERQTYGCYYLNVKAYKQFNLLINLYANSGYLSLAAPMSSQKMVKSKLLEAEEILQTTGNSNRLKQVAKSTEQQMLAIKSLEWYQF